MMKILSRPGKKIKTELQAAPKAAAATSVDDENDQKKCKLVK